MSALRRRIALWICPELLELPIVTGDGYPKPQSAVAKRRADDIRRLDAQYFVSTGVLLKLANAPAYSGPMYSWPSSRDDVGKGAVASIIRLRSNLICGVSMQTHFCTLNYFESIFPASAPWPSGIPRPSTKHGAA